MVIKMNDRISVIVPVYNVEEYLECCIKSLISQTYNNLEIFLINDGSTDSSGIICDRFAVLDPRIIVIHKENGGLSDARNKGLEHATGKYITFVDSDDFLECNFIKKLYEQIIKYGADISICDYLCTYSDDVQNAYDVELEEFVFSNKECLKKTYCPDKHGLEFVAWGKLYKKELFDKYSINYPLGRIHEDIFVTYQVMYVAKKIVFTNYIGYYYRQRNGSIMHKAFNKKNLDSIIATRKACEFFESKGEEELLELAVNYHLINGLKVYYKILNCPKEEENEIIKKQCLKELRKDTFYYTRHSELSSIKKIVYLLLVICPSKMMINLIINRRFI